MTRRRAAIARAGQRQLGMARLTGGHRYPRSRLRGDLLAGVTVAAWLVPQVMAYAQVAGLRPAAGLWAAVPVLVVYAALGSSRSLSLGRNPNQSQSPHRRRSRPRGRCRKRHSRRPGPLPDLPASAGNPRISPPPGLNAVCRDLRLCPRAGTRGIQREKRRESSLSHEAPGRSPAAWQPGSERWHWQRPGSLIPRQGRPPPRVPRSARSLPETAVIGLVEGVMISRAEVDKLLEVRAPGPWLVNIHPGPCGRIAIPAGLRGP